MKIPIYNIEVNLDDDATGMTAISFVEDPAIESNFLYFSKETKPMVFKVEDKMQHKVTGCAIWANKPIYRYSPSIGEYYTVFTPETIDRIVHKYAKQGLNNLVDLQHNGKMIDGVVMVEYFIKDTAKGIDPKGFEEIADGSLFVTYKIEDDELWNEIINPESEFKGFSIEINADIVPTGEFVEEEPEDDFGAFLSELVKALEGLDCEIIMSKEKKKPESLIVENDDDGDGENDGHWGLNYLFAVERSDIASAIDRKQTVLIDGKEKWLHSLGKRGKKDIVVLYDPNNGKWETRDIATIKEFEPTKTAIDTFPDLPNSITDNDDITIQRTVNTGSYSDLIHNRVPVMISYSDEQPNPHTGYRTCYIVAYGYTKANNECIRVFQQNGDSRSASEGILPLPSYRLMLTRRCKGFKPMQGVEKYPMSVLDTSIINWNGDRSMSPCIDHLVQSDFND